MAETVDGKGKLPENTDEEQLAQELGIVSTIHTEQEIALERFGQEMSENDRKARKAQHLAGNVCDNKIIQTEPDECLLAAEGLQEGEATEEQTELTAEAEQSTEGESNSSELEMGAALACLLSDPLIDLENLGDDLTGLDDLADLEEDIDNLQFFDEQDQGDLHIDWIDLNGSIDNSGWLSDEPDRDEGTKSKLEEQKVGTAAMVGTTDGKGKLPENTDEEQLAQELGIVSTIHTEQEIALERFGQEMSENDRKARKAQHLAGNGKMVKLCAGLPLAIIMPGGLLATKHTLREREMVHQNVCSHKWSDDPIQHDNGVSKVLALSYHNLPYQLKPCFLYFGHFPEDSVIDAKRLYHLWIADGIIVNDDKVGVETIMDVAERYLGALAQRRMVQLVCLSMRSVDTACMLIYEKCGYSLYAYLWIRRCRKTKHTDVDWILEFLGVLLEKHLINGVSDRNSSNVSGLSLSGNEIRCQDEEEVLGVVDLRSRKYRYRCLVPSKEEFFLGDENTKESDCGVGIMVVTIAMVAIVVKVESCGSRGDDIWWWCDGDSEMMVVCVEK
ncbi:hypothetical protein TEA_030168 [Camellia sinensis var. sinensis]|uniref:Disease resistance protein winged helix domain-containing protein n=1 Tax=Camellia sinensis var. sinensis TaxID=542762 RepID=A0A4S4EN53_CAMSN|nr:hypothetical protein TEA_030168 [Camellia sinensis var. sinensis]